MMIFVIRSLALWRPCSNIQRRTRRSERFAGECITLQASLQLKFITSRARQLVNTIGNTRCKHGLEHDLRAHAIKISNELFIRSDDLWRFRLLLSDDWCSEHIDKANDY